MNTLSVCSGTRSAAISGLPVAVDRFQWISPTTKPNAHVVNDITKRLAHNFKNITGILLCIRSPHYEYTLYELLIERVFLRFILVTTECPMIFLLLTLIMLQQLNYITVRVTERTHPATPVLPLWWPEEIDTSFN